MPWIKLLISKWEDVSASRGSRGEYITDLKVDNGYADANDLVACDGMHPRQNKNSVHISPYWNLNDPGGTARHRSAGDGVPVLDELT